MTFLWCFHKKIVWYLLHQVSSNWWNSENRLCIASPLIPQLNFKLNKTFRKEKKLLFVLADSSLVINCSGNWRKFWGVFGGGRLRNSQIWAPAVAQSRIPQKISFHFVGSKPPEYIWLPSHRTDADANISLFSAQLAHKVLGDYHKQKHH